MTQSTDMCRLDYLVGTLATAYKGVITSLVLKDFCITEKDGTASLRGSIISMPQGQYFASLMQEGSELQRVPLGNGFFEIETGAELIKNARNLQIDIVQAGRHIGTFLLKREKPDEFFTSAFQLSAELRDLDLSRLTRGVRDKPGLHKKAENLVSLIFSSKRDWKAVSDNINSFSRDLFWSNRESYYLCFDIFVRYSLGATESSPGDVLNKHITNFISLLELPLEQEEDIGRLSMAIKTWQQAVGDSVVDLSYALSSSKRLINKLRQRVPEIDITLFLRRLLSSFETRLIKMSAISTTVLDRLKQLILTDDIDRLMLFSNTKKEDLFETVSGAKGSLDRNSQERVADLVLDIQTEIFDDVELLNTLFDVITGGLTAVSAGPLLSILLETVSSLSDLSSEAQRRLPLNMAVIIRRLSELDLVDPVMTLMGRIGSDFPSMRDSILLDSGVGEALVATGDDNLLSCYADILLSVIIAAPKVFRFSSDTWAEIVDPLHLERLSKLLYILGLNSKRFVEVLTHLTCNLFITGVFIPDDKLFQRNVSAYLNTGAVRDNFLANYIFLQRLPVYFNEVGASGRLRDYSTELDSWGNDVILYFLRKQTHANASNYNVRLIEQIIKAWVYSDPDVLRGWVPDDILQKADRDLITAYSKGLRPLLEAYGVFVKQGLVFDRVLDIVEEEAKKHLSNLTLSDEVRRKVLLICMIYREVRIKYSSLGFTQENADSYTALARFVERCKVLNEIVVAPEKTEAQESLYYKRHIAFGIPSVMGSYHEPKFDALGEIYRTEEAIRAVLEVIITQIETSTPDIVIKDIRQWIRCLESVNELFGLHDNGNFQVDEIIAILTTNELRVSQVIDLLRIWQKELVSMVELCYHMFQGPLARVLKAFSSDELPDHLKHLSEKSGSLAEKAADVIFRDIISSIIGFTELDRLLSSLIEALSRYAVKGDQTLSLNNDSLHVRRCYLSGDLTDAQVMRLSPFLGSKAKNLFYLGNAGLPVPSFAVLSAEHSLNVDVFSERKGQDFSLKEAVRHIELKSGRLFGDPANPLFLAVRSGSYISMPGILSTVLYCGMNKDTLFGLIRMTGDPLLGWDSYRRFIEHYATIVFDIETEFFDEITARVVASERQNKWIASDNPRGLASGSASKYNEKNIPCIEIPCGLSGGSLQYDEHETREIVYAYMAELEKKGLRVPSDVYEQLRMSVQAIYRTWQKKRAVQFRKAMGVSDYWGTSVSLFEMISGNARGSGASVFFTRTPFTQERDIYGETREEVTGDDLVYGKMINRPISKNQTAVVTGLKSLEESDPDLFLRHKVMAELIEKAMRGLPQEVESTYTLDNNGKRFIYILQTKRMEVHHGLTLKFDDICMMAPRIIGRGVGVYGGALSGVASFSASLEVLKRLRQESGRPVILLRSTASTDDVSLMQGIDGIITSSGGPTSHAAILTQKFSLTAVVGCSDMVIDKADGVLYASFGGHTVREGDEISIDGSSGLVYLGSCLFTVQE